MQIGELVSFVREARRLAVRLEVRLLQDVVDASAVDEQRVREAAQPRVMATDHALERRARFVVPVLEQPDRIGGHERNTPPTGGSFGQELGTGAALAAAGARRG